MSTPLVSLLVTIVIVIGATGCGSDGSEKPTQPTTPQAVVKQFLREVAAKHHKAACALLSPAGRQDAADRFIVDFALFADSDKELQKPSCVGWLRQINAEQVSQDTLSDFGYTHTDRDQNHAVVRAKHGDWVLETVAGKWRIQSLETLAQAD